MNVGKIAARDARHQVARDLLKHRGSVLILHGDLSDELPSYPILQSAISRAMAFRRDLTIGFGAQVAADDPDHAQICVDELRKRNVPKDMPIKLTGAWYVPDNSYGCVNSTRDALLAGGFTDVEVADSALSVDDGQDEADAEATLHGGSRGTGMLEDVNGLSRRPRYCRG